MRSPRMMIAKEYFRTEMEARHYAAVRTCDTKKKLQANIYTGYPPDLIGVVTFDITIGLFGQHYYRCRDGVYEMYNNGKLGKKVE